MREADFNLWSFILVSLAHVPNACSVSSTIPHRNKVMSSTAVCPLALPLRTQLSGAVHMSLARTFAGDVASGTLAAALTAPLVCTIDRASTVIAAGKQPTLEAVKEGWSQIVQQPLAFITSALFLYVWFACGITYAAANALSSSSMPVVRQLMTVTAINSLACIVRDAELAKLYGIHRDRRPLPRSSYVAWCARDIATMGFVFTLPPLVAKWLPGIPKPFLQFALPLVCQYITAPLYLLGHAFYNLQGGPLHLQLTAVRTAYAGTVLMRQVRAVTQYSLTNVANARLRMLFA
eukprot:CAMPEP_0119087932 /NCGR_PEP_ID=MMETSP1178-20130426/143670_1 /TAXON_ID=33656 /ORGANISM="unid sp, Strain CCMP2000" /LENGTH=291 /DNA_ID=CAMNT_0007071181 /DNA_START=22 /DNA_END=897 /DNA_ORIENTATION=+